jgi:hypothetical protein
MRRPRVRAVLRTGRGRVIAALLVLVVLVVLAGSGYTVATQWATSMEITAWRTVMQWSAGQQRPPDVKVFDKIITAQPLVRDTQHQLDGLERDVIVNGCVPTTPEYDYQFSFATNGITTQVYTGVLLCVSWGATTLGVSASVVGGNATTLYGSNLMTTLHKLTGMPLPSGCCATSMIFARWR